MTDSLLRPADVARYLGVSRWTLRRIVDRGELRAIRVGQRERFRQEDVQAYLEREAAP